MPSTDPGCYGSVITAQETSATCIACPVKLECFKEAASRETAILNSVQRKLEYRGQDGIKQVYKFLHWRKATGATVAPTNKRSNKLLQRFETERRDLSGMKTGSNPFEAQESALFHHMAQAVMRDGVFKPKDIAEYVQEHFPTCPLTTKSLKSEVARFLTALVAAKVLERQEKFLLCLAR